MSRGLPPVMVTFLDGSKIEGRVMNFNIKRKVFHLMAVRADAQTTKAVMFTDVKTVHFLKEAAESKHYELVEEGIEKSESVAPIAYKLIVEFKDGEFLHGSALKYSPDEQGFYITPDNPQSPHEKIYINQDAVKKVDQRRLVGNILMDRETITTEQLEIALKKQREQRDQKIGSILKEGRSITDEQLARSLEAQKGKPKKRLGELLIDAGYISEKQLENALTMQRQRRLKRLGHILVELGYITPNDICIALSSQSKIPWVDLSKKKISSRTASLIPEEEARLLLAVPVDIKDDAIVVAIADPEIENLKERLESITGREVELAIAYDGHIEYIINSIYGLKTDT